MARDMTFWECTLFQVHSPGEGEGDSKICWFFGGLGWSVSVFWGKENLSVKSCLNVFIIQIWNNFFKLSFPAVITLKISSNLHYVQ